MNSQEMIKAMVDKGYRTSAGGQAPHATLYTAILREMNVKGKEPSQEDQGRQIHT